MRDWSTVLRSRRALLWWLLPAVLAGGCAHRGEVPSAPPGYDLAGEPWRGLDTSPLRGRRIVLDPGHGGVFRGVVGQDGLAEADVNLGVALYLRGLLEWAGAEVLLTRSVDRDFLSPADSSLAADLAARVALADSFAPDVFLSLHHNSNPRLDRDRNETQTYYPAGREGPDLDLARAVQARLVSNLGIQPARILPGNFYVLRHSPCPAVLGEPAMLSNPRVERRLSLAAKQALEARAYFLGLLDYFRGGTPAWSPPRVTADRVTWRWLPGGRDGLDGPDLDPASVLLTGDGRPLPAVVDPLRGLVTWYRDAGGAESRLALALRGCNLAGRPAPVRRDTLRPATERFRLAVDRDGAGRCRLRWRTLASPAGDFVSLRLAPPAGPAVTLVSRDSTGGEVLMPPGWSPGDAATLPVAWHRRDGVRGVTEAALVPGRDFPGTRWAVLAAPPPWPAGAVPGGAWRDRDGLPPGTVALPPGADRRSPVVPLPADRPAWLAADGAAPLRIPSGAAAAETLRWRALAPALTGRTVLVDPDGGGRRDLGRDAVGRSGSDLDLALARRLADLLRRAGARVSLTRTDDRFLDEPTRVLLANARRPDLMLVLTRGDPTGPAWRLRHYPGSRTGEPWARALAASLTATGLADSVTVEPDGGYLLRQVACPVVVVELPRPGRADGPPGREDRLAAWQRALACALLTGTADREAPGRISPATVDSLLAAAAAAGVPRPDWLLWEDNWPWQPLPDDVPWRTVLPLRGDRHVAEYRRGATRGVLLWERRDGAWSARAQPVTAPPAPPAGDHDAP